MYRPVGETRRVNCISLDSDARPEEGSTFIHTAKTSLSSRPRKNTGVA